MWKPPGCVGLALLALVGCGQPGSDSTDERRFAALQGPAGHLRPGSPLRVLGRGLSGCQLVLWSASKQVATAHWSGPVRSGAVDSVVDGVFEVVDARVEPKDSAVETGSISLDRACLRPAASAKQTAGAAGHCRSIEWLWRSAVSASAVSSAQDSVSFGEALTLQAEQVLLVGEGEVWLEGEVRTIDSGERVATTAIAVQHADWKRKSLRVPIEPGWLGPWPGARQLRLRLHQRIGEVEAVGPESKLALTVKPPKWQVKAGLRDVRRGAVLPVSIEQGVPGEADEAETGGWRLRISGDWKSNFGAQTWPKEAARYADGRGSTGALRAILSSTAWYQGGWPKVVESGSDPRFSGHVTLELFGAGRHWRDTWQPVQWRLRPTMQVVVVEMDDGFEFGLKPFGLSALGGKIRSRVLALMKGHFEGLRVEIAVKAPTTVAEYIQIPVLDRDPNGGALLGADNSHGQDVGNRRLDEDMSGYSAATRLAGEAAYGGVFLAGFEQFSKRLKPESSQASEAFDGIFEPWMPALGGTPATSAQADAAAAAVEAMARLIAGSLSHEVGHALGLAAGTVGYHHDGDHPGWRMDAGPARPFAERAGLAGAVEEIWGPVDSTYLQAILGKP